MSISVMTWVWAHSRSRNGARLVLLAIADSATDNGRNAWPSVRTLKTKANLSERAVQKAIKELVELGELKVEWNQGYHGSNLYTVLMRSTPAESAPPQNLRPAKSAGVKTEPESDTTPQEPPQILHPAESAPPQISTPTPADSAPEPSLNRPSSSSSKKTRTSSTTKGAAGTRIPDDFVINDNMAAWCRKEYPNLTRHQADAITAEFVDYWRGVPGARGLKLDWEATWRNRMRTKLEDSATSTGQLTLQRRHSGGSVRPSTTDAAVAAGDAALAEVRRMRGTA